MGNTFNLVLYNGRNTCTHYKNQVVLQSFLQKPAVPLELPSFPCLHAPEVTLSKPFWLFLWFLLLIFHQHAYIVPWFSNFRYFLFDSCLEDENCLLFSCLLVIRHPFSLPFHHMYKSESLQKFTFYTLVNFYKAETQIISSYFLSYITFFPLELIIALFLIFKNFLCMFHQFFTRFSVTHTNFLSIP